VSDVCLSVAYIGPKSRTERPRKIKIGTEVAHVTRDSDTTFKVKRSKVNLQGAGAYCGGLAHSLLSVSLLLALTYHHFGFTAKQYSENARPIQKGFMASANNIADLCQGQITLGIIILCHSDGV